MRKGIVRILKHDQRNWHYISPNTTFVIPQLSDNYIQTRRNSDYDASIGAHNL